MQRIPALEGALNFRDLGGYAVADGRTVRWNTVYRSGTTHAMTLADIAQLSANGIRYAYDLRSNAERREYPSRLTEIADLHYRYREHDSLPGDIRQLLKSRHTRPEDARRVMVSVYKSLPYEFEDSFRALFESLAEGDLPLVFNCTAGKDRTGVAAALMLSALGASRETIFEDYLLTRQFFDQSCELLLNREKKNAAAFGQIDRAIWEPLMGVHPDYLRAMFDELQASHGSVEKYLSGRLGIHGKLLARLRANLLE